jgi:hypothetical protein
LAATANRIGCGKIALRDVVRSARRVKVGSDAQ